MENHHVILKIKKEKYNRKIKLNKNFKKIFFFKNFF